jgi:ParB-like chromosome segregation protein Spo0J
MELRKITELNKLENNPRFIRDEDFKILCESIKTNPDYFMARPLILSNRTGQLVIIAGNQRYEAAKEIGLETVPTYLIPDLTEEKEHEIIIRDNVSNGQWDYDILANEWEQDELISWGVELPSFEVLDPDEAEEKEKPVVEKRCPHCNEIID